MLLVCFISNKCVKVATDLNVPCTNLELHALCKLLDPELTGLIEYKYFTPPRLESKLKYVLFLSPVSLWFFIFTVN